MDKVLAALYQAVDEFNRQSPAGPRLKKAADAPLYGGAGPLDSLGLVNLVVSAEEKLRRAFGVRVTLADAKALSQKRSPFRTLGSLAEYARGLLGAHAEKG